MTKWAFWSEVFQQLFALLECFLVKLASFDKLAKATFHFCFSKQGFFSRNSDLHSGTELIVNLPRIFAMPFFAAAYSDVNHALNE